MKILRSSRGYSLAELLIVVAIMGSISTVGPLLMRQLQNFYLMTGARNDIERDARVSLDIIDRNFRQAKNATVILDSLPGQPPFSRVRFTKIDGSNWSFYQKGGALYMGRQTDTTILTTNLVYVAFTYPDTDNPTIASVSMSTGKAIQLGNRKVLELTIQKVRIMN